MHFSSISWDTIKFTEVISVLLKLKEQSNPLFLLNQAQAYWVFLASLWNRLNRINPIQSHSFIDPEGNVWVIELEQNGYKVKVIEFSVFNDIQVSLHSHHSRKKITFMFFLAFGEKAHNSSFRQYKIVSV